MLTSRLTLLTCPSRVCSRVSGAYTRGPPEEAPPEDDSGGRRTRQKQGPRPGRDGAQDRTQDAALGTGTAHALCGLRGHTPKERQDAPTPEGPT